MRHRLGRRLALWLLRAELDAREANARNLSQKAYQEFKAGAKGRIWWDGYLHGVRSLRTKDPDQL